MIRLEQPQWVFQIDPMSQVHQFGPCWFPGVDVAQVEAEDGGPFPRSGGVVPYGGGVVGFGKVGVSHGQGAGRTPPVRERPRH